MRLAFCAVLVACSNPPPAPVNAIPPAAKADVDPKLAEAIRAAAKGYATWGRVDDIAKLAPIMCDAPRPEGQLGRVRMSEAGDQAHGKKLYYLWASQRDAYLRAPDKIGRGFSIVKESFAAVPGAAPASPHTGAPRVRDTVQVDGAWLKTGAAKDLYVMTKLADGPTPDTDDGWIYGTIATDGTVTSAGRVSTCMSCHADAGHGRLFGLKP